MTDEIETLARLLFAAKHQSRRQAKRLIREAGGHGSAEELDALLTQIEQHPRRADILRLAGELHAADLAAEAAILSGGPPEEQESWFVCEATGSRRTYLLYLCPGGAESFLGEVFDDGDQPAGWQAWPLDDGQWLSNFLWLDGDPPEASRLKHLAGEARRQLRLYDARLELEE